MYVVMTGRPEPKAEEHQAVLPQTGQDESSSGNQLFRPLVAKVAGDTYVFLQTKLLDQVFDLWSHRTVADDASSNSTPRFNSAAAWTRIAALLLYDSTDIHKSGVVEIGTDRGQKHGADPDADDMNLGPIMVI
jgi:hypothetical protein